MKRLDHRAPVHLASSLCLASPGHILLEVRGTFTFEEWYPLISVPGAVSVVKDERNTAIAAAGVSCPKTSDAAVILFLVNIITKLHKLDPGAVKRCSTAQLDTDAFCDGDSGMFCSV